MAKEYNLSKRTGKFGKEVILFVKQIPENTITRPLLSQLIRSAKSIGANYMEADVSESINDFRHKIGICCKEANETKHWIEMISVAYPGCDLEAKRLYQESHELLLIFFAIRKVKKSQDEE